MKKFILVFLAFVLVVFGMISESEALTSQSKIPLIHGTWNLSGSGYWGSTPVIDNGTITMVSFINWAGYEVITKFFYEGEIRDRSGTLLLKDSYTLDVELGSGIIVNSMNVRIIGLDQNIYDITLQSGVFASAHRTGYIHGRWVEGYYTLTKSSAPVQESPDSIPHIGGTWETNGSGTWDGIRVTDRGTSILTTYIAPDGYEIVTGYSYVGEIRDSAGNLLQRDNYTLDANDLGGEIRITSKVFPVVIEDNRQTFSIASNSRITSKRIGEVYGGFVEADYTFTRNVPPDPKPTPGTANGAWIIASTANVYKYEGQTAGGTWTWTPAQAKYITAVNENICWVSEASSNTLYKFSKGIWEWTPAKSKWVSAYTQNDLWLVEANTDTLFNYKDGVWIWTPAKTKVISAPNDKVLWLVEKNSGYVFKHTPSTGTWEWTPGTALSLSAATEDIVWVIALTGDWLFRYDHRTGEWKWHNIRAKAVSAVSESEAWFVDMNGKLCIFKDGEITVVGGACADVSAYPSPAISSAAKAEALSSGDGSGEGSYDGQGTGCSASSQSPAGLLFTIPLLLIVLKRNTK